MLYVVVLLLFCCCCCCCCVLRPIVFDRDKVQKGMIRLTRTSVVERLKILIKEEREQRSADYDMRY